MDLLRERPRAATSWARWSSVGIGLVSLLLIATPSSGSAVLPHSTWGISAPFHGSTLHRSQQVRTGCARSSLKPRAEFNLSSGFGGFSLSSEAGRCKAGSGSGDVRTYALLDTKLRLPDHPSITVAFVNFSYTAAFKLTVNAGTCIPYYSPSYCDASAEVNFTVWTEALNVSTGYVIPGTAGYQLYQFGLIYNGTYCVGSNCSTGSGGYGQPPASITNYASLKVPFSPKMTKGGDYVAEILVEGSTWVDTSVANANSSALSAVASIDFGSGGNGLAVSSIVER